MVMDDVEVPHYFICPISLQIMKDPITVVTGITYDRDSIEQWLSSGKNTSCPVTKQPLLTDSDLTPNHTLRRLIQAWCTANASNGVHRIPTPKSPLSQAHVLKLLQDLSVPQLYLKSLKKLENLASEGERNKRCLIKAGAGKAMLSVVVNCFKKDITNGLEEALNVLHRIRTPIDELNLLSMENFEIFDSLAWVLRREMDNHLVVKTLAVSVMKSIIEVANSYLLERLKPYFFEAVIQVLRDGISQQVTKAVLHVLLGTCPYGRNKMKIVEAGAVFDLIQLELSTPDKRTSELNLGVLDHLCSCADGRAKFLAHFGGIAVVSKRILRVSSTADDRAVRILASINKFSATNEVLQEMLKVGAVAKLCMVLQAQSSANLREKARGVLRLHSNIWSNSPCIHVYLLTNNPR